MYGSTVVFSVAVLGPNVHGNITGEPLLLSFWPLAHVHYRLSGYLLFPMLLFTIHLAGSWSDWVTMSSLYAIRVVAYDIAPLVLFAAILSRVRYVQA